MGLAVRGGSGARCGGTTGFCLTASGGGDVREGERKEPKEAGKAGPLLDVCTQDFSLGQLQCASASLLSSHLSQPCCEKARGGVLPAASSSGWLPSCPVEISESQSSAS